MRSWTSSSAASCRVSPNRDSHFEISDGAKDRILEVGYEPEFGARPLRRAIRDLIEDPLSERLLAGEVQPGDRIAVIVDDEASGLDFEVLERAENPEDEEAEPEPA